MRLMSEGEQWVHIGDTVIEFAAQEPIVTEHSYKYDIDQFADMAHAAGFRLAQHWSDERQWFSVCMLEVCSA